MISNRGISRGFVAELIYLSTDQSCVAQHLFHHLPSLLPLEISRLKGKNHALSTEIEI